MCSLRSFVVVVIISCLSHMQREHGKITCSTQHNERQLRGFVHGLLKENEEILITSSRHEFIGFARRVIHDRPLPRNRTTNPSHQGINKQFGSGVVFIYDDHPAFSESQHAKDRGDISPAVHRGVLRGPSARNTTPSSDLCSTILR